MPSNGYVNLSDPTVALDTSGGDEKKKARTFRGEAGHTYRIYFPTQEVCERRRHWSQGVKNPDGTVTGRGYFRCTQDTHGYCPVCAKSAVDKNMKRSMQTFGANIIVYDTDIQGNPVSPLSAYVAFWAFGAPKFDNLRQLIREWGELTNYDLIVTCTDTQFQKMMIQPAKRCIVKESPELWAQVQKMLQTDCVPLDKFLCRDVSVGELAGIFGIPASEIPPQFLSDGGTVPAPAQPAVSSPAPGIPPQPVSPAPAVPVYGQNQPQVMGGDGNGNGNGNYTNISELADLL